MSDRLLLATSGIFALSTAAASVVAARSPVVPGEPLGLRAPGSVPAQLVAGWGAGIAAPWPMPAVATWSAWRSTGDPSGPARTVATVGAMVLVGTAIEPVTWGRRPATPAARAAIVANLASGVSMVLAGAHRLRSR